jgi:hypothetical protein
MTEHSMTSVWYSCTMGYLAGNNFTPMSRIKVYGGRQLTMKSLRFGFVPRHFPRAQNCYQVSEETVLTDRTGVHLGAGPYMLLYSRALTPDEQTAYESKTEWPELLRVCRLFAAVGCTIFSDALNRTQSNTITMYSCLPCNQRFESDSSRMIANLPLARKLCLA